MSTLLYKTYMMDEDSCAFLKDFKERHRYSMSQVLRCVLKQYTDKEKELLRILAEEYHNE